MMSGASSLSSQGSQLWITDAMPYRLFRRRRGVPGIRLGYYAHMGVSAEAAIFNHSCSIYFRGTLHLECGALSFLCEALFAFLFNKLKQ